MAAMAKTIVATGTSSGLGFEAIKQLFVQPETTYNFILGVQNTTTAQSAYGDLPSPSLEHALTILPLELTDLRTVKKFASQVLQTLGSNNIDILFLNAALVKSAEEAGVNGSKYNEPYLVNHLSQHYLIHLLRDKLVSSHSRIVFVSSGSLSSFTEIKSLDEVVKAQNGAGFFSIYPATKFVQLLSAHWWRRELTGQCEVLAVSPGKYKSHHGKQGSWQRNVDLVVPEHVMKDAKSMEEGARSILAAFTRSDFPEDMDQIFLTSWGEWWPKDKFQLSLNKELQDKWAVSKETIEKEELVD
ncbi:NAD(P)-binding protein [Venturia nashicola]|nr:NAD(P)-binding protein [Venturia nashicola]